jgi:hypothetical protein
VEVVRKRWIIESCFEEAKGDVGLDEYEVWSFKGRRGVYHFGPMDACVFLAALRAKALEAFPKVKKRHQRIS